VPANFSGVGAAVDRETVPQLTFRIAGATSAPYSALPTVTFELEVAADSGQPIRSVLLDIQIQIAARLRPYSEPAQERLLGLFGTPERWPTTLRTLPWARATVVVPPFTDSTVVEVPVLCTYDLEVTAAQYLAALEDGQVPLEFLFSGTIFYSADDGRLQAARVDWNHDADFRLPVSLWRETMDRHFAGTAWLRLSRTTLDSLCAYRARHAHASFDDALASLLGDSEEPA
jgi:hypothetical protein